MSAESINFPLQKLQSSPDDDGFTVADSDAERMERKKKRKIKVVEDLDEDDYELLRENNIVVPKGSKKFKRLKKAQKALDDDQFGLYDDELDGDYSKGGLTAEEKVKRTLFDDDDDDYG
ncbi:putative suppressor of ty [Corchorus olitorius]|uniref:Suppressor of ty n=1 Tax=Corchorus olitorius TaxID=93759 RepID=A0A1R3I0B8_9ROSI|nr:putative suppressor of ty [Corchorus olitorius]